MYLHVIDIMYFYMLLCNPIPKDHSRLIPMYNARFILWPSSLSSPTFLIWEESDGGHVE